MNLGVRKANPEDIHKNLPGILTIPTLSYIMKLASHEVGFIIAGGDPDPMKTRVKEMRTANGWTQQQLADLVHVSARTIISIEKEQYNPSLMLSYRMARVFRTTIEDLCCLKENKELEDRKYEGL